MNLFVVFFGLLGFLFDISIVMCGLVLLCVVLILFIVFLLFWLGLVEFEKIYVVILNDK